MSGTAERSLSLRLPEPFHHWRLLEADSLNITKTVFVFIKGLWGRQAQNNVVVTTYKKQKKVYTCTVLDNLNLYCQNATKCSLLFFGEERKNSTKCSVSFQSQCLGDIGRPHGWLWPRPTERMHSWDGHWQCTGWDAQPSAPSVSAHSSESHLKTTVSAVLCNWGWLWRKGRAGGRDYGLMERKNEGRLFKAEHWNKVEYSNWLAQC